MAEAQVTGGAGDVPARAVALQLPPGRSVREGVTCWDGAGHLLGTGLAVLYGRTTSDPAVLRASAAAALAMADTIEHGG